MTRRPELFDHAFLERQQAVYPHLDVHIFAAAVREFCSHQEIRNPNGLLVHWLKRADAVFRQNVANRGRDTALEQEQYAELWQSILHAAVDLQLGPAAIARFMDEARRCGFTKLNERLIRRLANLGEKWPEDTRHAALFHAQRPSAPGAARTRRS